MTNAIEKKMEELKVDHCHLGAYSFAGVDARAAISLNGASDYVKSLTTVCTPHLGCQLIDKVYGESQMSEEYI